MHCDCELCSCLVSMSNDNYNTINLHDRTSLFKNWRIHLVFPPRQSLIDDPQNIYLATQDSTTLIMEIQASYRHNRTYVCYIRLEKPSQSKQVLITLCFHFCIFNQHMYTTFIKNLVEIHTLVWEVSLPLSQLMFFFHIFNYFEQIHWVSELSSIHTTFNRKHYVREFCYIKIMPPKITLYYLSLSPPVRSVLLTAKALGIELELKNVNLLEGEHLTSEFTKVCSLFCSYLWLFA